MSQPDARDHSDRVLYRACAIRMFRSMRSNDRSAKAGPSALYDHNLAEGLIEPID